MTVFGGSFAWNNANYTGGAIYNDYTGTLVVHGASFAANHAQYGGAIASWGHLSDSASEYQGNWVTQNGGAIENVGTATIQNSTFYQNSATLGGAIANFGTLNVSGSHFDSNHAYGRGGGVWTAAGCYCSVYGYWDGHNTNGNGIDERLYVA